MQTKCWPRAQSRKTDSRGSLERGSFRKGRKGWDRCLEKRKKEGGRKKSRKKLERNSQPRGQGHFPAIPGLVSLESSEVQAQSSLNAHQSPT